MTPERLLGRMYFASFRLAFALVCVGASLILAAHWLGFLPDAAAARMKAKQSVSEAIAVNSAAHIRKQQWVDLRACLQTQVDRDPDLLSVGIRSDLGVLRLDTGHHAEFWPGKGEERAGVSAVHVPITLNRRPWGEVELCFHQPVEGRFAKLMRHPLARLVAFFFVAGMMAYGFFVVRILRVFNNTQVVPDRVRRALDTLAEGLLVLDERGSIVLANKSFAEIVDADADELTNQLASDLNWVQDDRQAEPYPWMYAINSGEIQTESMLRYRLPDGRGRIFSVNAAPLGQDGSQRGALATFRDVTHVEEHRAELERMLGLLRNSRDEIKRKNCELEILATQDALTECLNRRAFFERFDKQWDEAIENNEPLSCMMVDVDHFKSVNDTYGHHTGDDVLRKVSSTIRTLHSECGIVCRYGGEEFCVLLPSMDLKQAVAQAERLRQAINAIIFEEPAELRITASLGVSEIRFEATDPQDLINQADACLYVAKREGRNRVIAYNRQMATEISQEDSLQATRSRIDIPYQAVTALLTALSYRDTNTAEHSRRVADLCARIADGMLDPAQTYVLEIAALLHDIGKIGVPDDVLLKPGPLTAEEWELMGRHDRIGVEIVASAFECPELSAIIANHHAFYGGKGRDPHLPSGDQIPVGARILAIADSYDAMTSDRVYRKGRSHDEALAELRRCAGTQFDPRMVEHFAQRITSTTPAVASGALSIRKMTAIEIGHQVERLAGAVAAKDVDGIRSLANRLSRIASHTNITHLVEAAEKIESATVNDDAQWLAVLRDTHELLDQCRATQSSYLRQSLECGAPQVNKH